VDGLLGRAELVTGASEDAAKRITHALEVQAERAQEATQATDRQVARVDEANTALRRHVAEAAVHVDAAVTRADSGRQALGRLLGELRETTENAERGLARLAEAVGQRSEHVGRATADAIHRVDAWDRTLAARAESMRAAAREVADRVREASVVFEGQTKDLLGLSQEAATLAGALKRQTTEAGIDDFLHRATFISERLQSIAVDLTRIVEASVTEDDWRRYNRGEKGVFVRKLLGFRDKAKLAQINDAYQTDGVLRETVGRYLAEFEKMLTEARARDREGVLATTFLSSDMGKLYILLGRAIGRDEASAS